MKPKEGTRVQYDPDRFLDELAADFRDRGFSLLRLHAMKARPVIALIEDSRFLPAPPKDYPVFTIAEFTGLAAADPKLWNLMFTAKMQGAELLGKREAVAP